MEPRIQYARTADGVNIAYWTMGEGMPFVSASEPTYANIQLAWRHIPELRRWYERLARNRRLVGYDSRGSGLSQRNVAHFSVEALVLDLEAVVDRLGFEKFALTGQGDSGPVAIAYTARHPERVSHLVLWCTYAQGSGYLQAPEVPGLLALAETDWHLFTETWAHAMVGWSERDAARGWATVLREGVTQEAFRAFWQATLEFDVTAVLGQVRSPTLVLHRRDIRWMTTDMARDLASRIPDARLVVLEGNSGVPWVGDADAVLDAIEEFLGEGEEAATTEPPEAGAFRTVLFTDVEGSTALTQRLGDARARELLREHERMVREALKSHGGSEVKTMGDGFMTSFSSATKALECAIAMQRAFAERNRGVGAALAPSQGAASDAPTVPTPIEPLQIRVGLNAGEPIAEDDPDGRSDLYGTAVNEAARITASAKGGEILVSNVVRELAKGKDFLFADCGETELKGFDEPVRLYEVRWRGDA